MPKSLTGCGYSVVANDTATTDFIVIHLYRDPATEVMAGIAVITGEHMAATLTWSGSTIMAKIA